MRRARSAFRDRFPSRGTLRSQLEELAAESARLARREAFLTAAIASMDVGVIAVDTDGAPVIWNQHANFADQDEPGADPPGAGERSPASWADIYATHRADGKTVENDELPINRALLGDRVVGEEIETMIGGALTRLSISASPITLPDGTNVGAVCTGADISKLHKRERELTRANADLDAIARATQQVLNGDDARQAVVDAALEVSDAVSAMLFEPARPGSNSLDAVAQAGVKIVGLQLAADSPSRTAEAFRTGRVQFVTDMDSDSSVDQSRVAEINAARAGAPPLRAMLALPVLRDGVSRAVLTVALDSPVSTSNLRLLGLLELLATDAALAISREDTARELSRLASTDSLTGLANRRSWDERLESEIERARRTELPLTVVILDLDHFKAFNDSRGHQAGDDLLAAGAKSWQSVLRSGDTLARLGGEEFGVLLPGCSSASAPGLVERLIRALPDGQTASAGVAQWAGEPSGHTIARADEALYEAKRAGRATYRMASNEITTGLPSPRPAGAA